MKLTEKQFKTLTKAGIVAVVCFLVAPFIFVAIGGFLGLVAAGVIGSVTLALMPAFTEKMAQLKFSALKGVIDRAPVETLLALSEKRVAELNEQRTILQQQAAGIEMFKKKATAFIAKYPEDKEQMQDQMMNYERLFAYRVDLFKEAKAATDKFLQEVDKAEAIYDMAVADAALGKSFNQGKDFMTIFREKTAFDAIDKLNSNAIANLRMALVDDVSVTKTIEGKETHAIAYDKDDKVVLGSILDLNQLKVKK